MNMMQMTGAGSAKDHNALITILSTQSMAGNRDGVELVTEGNYSVDNDGVHLSYMESELTGLAGTKTDIMVKADEVIMSRRGAVTTDMVFQKGRRHHFAYQTAIGTLTMGLATHRVNSDMGEKGGNMEIVYDINFDRALCSRNMFRINVRPLN